MSPSVPEESAEELYELAPCGYLTTLLDGSICRVNQTFLSWTGYTRALLLDGMCFQQLLTTAGQMFYETHYRPLLHMQGFVNEVAFDLRCPTRSPLPVLVNAVQARDEAGRPYSVRITIFDATDRRRYEQELLRARREAEQLATIVKVSTDAILRMDADGTVQSWNLGAKQMFGYQADEAIGKPLRELIVPDDKAGEFHKVLRELATGCSVQSETEYRHKEDRLLHVSINMTPHFAPVDGFVSISAIIRDITARKQAENALLELTNTLEQRVLERTAELERSNRDLDQFAHVVAHDLKTPLRGIEHLAAWIAEDAGPLLPPDSKIHLRKLQKRVNHMERLLDDLLTYSQVDRAKGSQTRVDLEALICRIIELLSPPSSFSFYRLVEVSSIITYQAPLEMVLRNLIDNALKHHDRADGKIQIKVTDNQQNDCHNFVTISVRDDGPGIDSVHHGKIFEIFQTLSLSKEDNNSGLGLALVRKTVESFGGSVYLESEPAAGSTFSFTWPRRIGSYLSHTMVENS